MKRFFDWLRPCLSICVAGVFLQASMVAAGNDGDPPRFAGFEKSAVAGARVPEGLSEPLRAMWHAKAGEWERAHEIAQDIKTPTGSWIHAFLHREEGDIGNAGFWYRRAGMTMPKKFTIEQEWSFIARELWKREHGIDPGMIALTSPSGPVATADAPADAEEGAWDTLIHIDGGQTIRIANALPVSFSPAGDVLLLREAAADDDLRHFLHHMGGDDAPMPRGGRPLIGGRHVAKAEWAEDGTTITFHYDRDLAGEVASETVNVAGPAGR